MQRGKTSLLASLGDLFQGIQATKKAIFDSTTTAVFFHGQPGYQSVFQIGNVQDRVVNAVEDKFQTFIYSLESHPAVTSKFLYLFAGRM